MSLPDQEKPTAASAFTEAQTARTHRIKATVFFMSISSLFSRLWGYIVLETVVYYFCPCKAFIATGDSMSPDIVLQGHFVSSCTFAATSFPRGGM
jgi:hypothetical protein